MLYTYQHMRRTWMLLCVAARGCLFCFYRRTGRIEGYLHVMKKKRFTWTFWFWCKPCTLLMPPTHLRLRLCLCTFLLPGRMPSLQLCHDFFVHIQLALFNSILFLPPSSPASFLCDCIFWRSIALSYPSGRISVPSIRAVTVYVLDRVDTAVRSICSPSALLYFFFLLFFGWRL